MNSDSFANSDRRAGGGRENGAGKALVISRETKIGFYLS